MMSSNDLLFTLITCNLLKQKIQRLQRLWTTIIPSHKFVKYLPFVASVSFRWLLPLIYYSYDMITSVQSCRQNGQYLYLTTNYKILNNVSLQCKQQQKPFHHSSSLLSASLYFSKRGAYWDRLCRDVVGRWLSRACTVAKRCILGL